MEDGRDELKKIQNGSYFHQGLTRDRNAKKCSKKGNFKAIKKNISNNKKDH